MRVCMRVCVCAFACVGSHIFTTADLEYVSVCRCVPNIFSVTETVYCLCMIYDNIVLTCMCLLKNMEILKTQ